MLKVSSFSLYPLPLFVKLFEILYQGRLFLNIWWFVSHVWFKKFQSFFQCLQRRHSDVCGFGAYDYLSKVRVNRL